MNFAAGDLHCGRGELDAVLGRGFADHCVGASSNGGPADGLRHRGEAQLDAIVVEGLHAFILTVWMICGSMFWTAPNRAMGSVSLKAQNTRLRHGRSLRLFVHRMLAWWASLHFDFGQSSQNHGGLTFLPVGSVFFGSCLT